LSEIEELMEQTEIEEDHLEEEELEETEQEIQSVQLLTKPFEVRLEAKHVKALKKIVRIADELKIEDITFTFDGKSLSVRHMDVSRIALLKASITLRETVLDDFVNEDETSVFAVVLSQLKRALNIEEPTFRLDDKLYIEGKIGLKDAQISLRLVDDYDSPEEIPEPKVTFKVTTTVNVKKIIDDVEKLIADPAYLRLISDKTGLAIEFDTELQTGKLGVYPSNGEGKANYSIAILKALGSGDWKLQFSTDMPMKATYDIDETLYEGTSAGRKVETASIAVWAAPRIEG